MQIHTQHDKFEVVSQMCKMLYVAEFATEWQENFFYLLYIIVHVCGGDFN